MTIVSLFDESGNAVRDAAALGEHCYCLDLQNDGRVEIVGSGSITFLCVNVLDPGLVELVTSLRPRLILSFPPCTDLTVCGTRHWADKAAVDPLFQERAMELVMIAPMLGDILGVPWMFENPVGRVSTLWRRPDYIFSPHEYGGWLPEDDVHPRFPEFIAPRDAYPKKTCIWSGNGMVMPEKRPVPCPEGLSKQYMKLGGKSELTKRIRSETPRGFARALLQANMGPPTTAPEITVQTFLPYPNFASSAAVLDYRRLGKQRVEAHQILSAIRNGGGWRNHPAVRMWRGHERALQFYADVMVREWVRRGYQNTIQQFLPPLDQIVMPPWLGGEEFHASHRGVLLWKDPAHYGQFGWTEQPTDRNIWPVTD